MGGEKMVAKRSIASLVRKKLSDITNSQAHPKLHSQPEKPLETYSPSDKNCIQQLLKERDSLMQLLAERDKIIEQNGAELMRLRANVQKLKLQNWNLAQSNTQMLAELNLGRERIKSLQHEILCKAALLNGNYSVVEEKVDMKYEINGSISQEGVDKESKPLLKASSDEKVGKRNTRRTKRSRSSSTASTKDPNVTKEKIEMRPRLRRQSGSFKTHKYEALENSFEMENAETAMSQCSPNFLSSPDTEDEKGENSALKTQALTSSFGTPLRKTVEKVQSCKEIPLKLKLRRLE